VAMSKIRKWVEGELKKFDYYLLSIVSIDNYFVEKDCTLKYIYEDELSFDYIILSKETISERIRYINYVISAFNKLSEDERIIIYCLYICKEKTNSESICEKMNISLSKYFRDKKEAITRMAYALGIEGD
jgi:ArpU family phage transcriptional regulator